MLSAWLTLQIDFKDVGASSVGSVFAVPVLRLWLELLMILDVLHVTQALGSETCAVFDDPTQWSDDHGVTGTWTAIEVQCAEP